MKNQTTYHQKLGMLMDDFVDTIFSVCEHFPDKELFVTTSQLKRAALSVPLNYQEGFGRFSTKANTQFLKIAFGSLRECQYLIHFSARRDYLNSVEYERLKELTTEIYAMLWGILKHPQV